MRNFFVLFDAVAWTFFILLLCFKNQNDIPDINIEHLDKVVHFIFHFGFTLLWFLYFKNVFQKSSFKPIAISLWFLSLLFGLIIEFLQQQITDNRSADSFDVLFNAIGASVAVLSACKSKFLQDL